MKVYDENLVYLGMPRALLSYWLSPQGSEAAGALQSRSKVLACNGERHNLSYQELIILNTIYNKSSEYLFKKTRHIYYLKNT